MIPYTSCMCFNAERGRPWRLVSAQKGTSLVVAKDEDHSFCIQIGAEESTEEEEPAIIHSRLTASEECILEAVLLQQKSCPMGSEEEVRIVPGRRTRQPVITKVVHLHLLDDTYAGVANMLLSKCGNWSFNTFNLDVSTGGRSLSYLLVHLFHEYGFVSYFGLDVVKVWHCFSLMEAAYHRHNPYHNSVHAADVTQAMHCFLQENKFSSHLTPLEAMSSVIAAVAHDLDHPGVTQAFLVATSNHLVNLYHNSSVLENHHWRTAISCLSESGIFDHLEREIWMDIQRQIRSLILATDITRQKEFLTKFKSYLHTESLDMEKSQYRHFALQIALKCADLCNPCRPWPISQRWSYQVCQEFYRQGAYERQLRLPLTPTFDCSRTKVAKIQADFFQFVVSPLFETWDNFLQSSLSGLLLKNLRHNYCQWQCKMEAMQRATEMECRLLKEETAPRIQIDSSSLSIEDTATSSEPASGTELLTIDTSDIVLKQHRSRSDSGLSPRLLSPKIHMETYSTEELHPSTTLLSLSSITNTVQLRQVYATTKVESHLICPTVFQPLLISGASPKPSSSPTTEECNNEEARTEDVPNELEIAQSPTISCPDGCCTPRIVSENPLCSQVSQPPVDDLLKPHEVSSKRRASEHCSRTIETKPVVSRCQSQTLISLSNAPPLSTCVPSENNEDGPILSVHLKDKTAISVSTNDNRCHDQDGPPPRKVRSEGDSTISLETEDSYHSPQSWCWHISRSFSAERPQRPSQDFDSPVPSLPVPTAQGVLTCHGYGGRRASAPMAVSFTADLCGSQASGLEDIDTKGGLKGGAEEDYSCGRRWSIPMETLTGAHIGKPTSSTTNLPESHSITDEAVRRHSFGPFDPLFAISALESDNGVRQSTCIVKSNHPSCNLFASTEMPESELNEHLDTETVSSCDTPLPCFSPSHKTSVPRRGSLPAEVPIALMCHVASPSRHLPKPMCSEQFPSSKEPSRSQSIRSNRPGHIWEHNKRHGSPTDLLSVLIGPTGMLNTMHGIVSGRTPKEWPCTVTMDYSRRRSGGLEMLSGLWRSRTSETPIGTGMATKIKLQRQLLEDWASWRRGEDAHVSTGATISALSQQFAYQQRRGSVPLNASLLSLSSGNTCSGEHGD